MARKKREEFICPECCGDDPDCYLCYGTGWATDDDNFEPLYHYDDSLGG